jgi:hypothetical protein
MKIALLVIASISCTPVVARSAPQVPDGFPDRFVPYEPSYVILRRAADDERAMQAHYSFRYILHSSDPHNGECDGNPACNHEFYFSYTGEFEFYVGGTRPSSPVVNRLNNPALHYRRYFGEDRWWIDLGVEHRSNGQVADLTAPDEIGRAQHAYASNDHAYFDTVSRSANYLSLEGFKLVGEVSALAKLKLYQNGEESNVPWVPALAGHTKFSHYDRLRLTARMPFGCAFETGIEWTVGDLGLKTDSWDWDLAYYPDALFRIPVYVRYHHGPMRVLSNYTQDQQSIGFGIKFIRNPGRTRTKAACTSKVE